MKEVNLKDWESFESEISRIFRSIEDRRAANKGYVSAVPIAGSDLRKLLIRRHKIAE